MKTICAFVFILFVPAGIVCASERTMTCSMQGLKDSFSFVIPQENEKRPKLEFSYPIDVTIFSMRNDNLLLVAMDHEEPSRPRMFISAQKKKNTFNGQYMTDSGGNQIQLDNGSIECSIK